MTINLEASGGASPSQSTWPMVITLPSAYTTVKGDCIILNLGSGVDISALTGASGCGATWTVLPGALTFQMTYVGTNCSAGGTTVTLSGISAGTFHIDYSIGVLSGLGSFVSAPTRCQHINGCTTPSLTFPGNCIVVGAGLINASPAVWGNGGTDHLINFTVFWYGSLLSYQLPNVGGSTTYGVSSATSSNYAGQEFYIAGAGSGDFFLVL